MSDKKLFIYDGECPFCKHFAELIELKTNLPTFKILDGRKDLPLLSQLYSQGYDLNKGGILINNGNILHGADAINWICTEIKEPNDTLLELLRIIFTSKKTFYLYLYCYSFWLNRNFYWCPPWRRSKCRIIFIIRYW